MDCYSHLNVKTGSATDRVTTRTHFRVVSRNGHIKCCYYGSRNFITRKIVTLVIIEEFFLRDDVKKIRTMLTWTNKYLYHLIYLHLIYVPYDVCVISINFTANIIFDHRFISM